MFEQNELRSFPVHNRTVQLKRIQKNRTRKKTKGLETEMLAPSRQGKSDEASEARDPKAIGKKKEGSE